MIRVFRYSKLDLDILLCESCLSDDSTVHGDIMELRHAQVPANSNCELCGAPLQLEGRQFRSPVLGVPYYPVSLRDDNVAYCPHCLAPVPNSPPRLVTHYESHPGALPNRLGEALRKARG